MGVGGEEGGTECSRSREAGLLAGNSEHCEPLKAVGRGCWLAVVPPSPSPITHQPVGVGQLGAQGEMTSERLVISVAWGGGGVGMEGGDWEWYLLRNPWHARVSVRVQILSPEVGV